MAVLGADALLAQLKSLRKEMGKPALRRAVRAGARPVRDAARSLVPRRTGAAARKIVVAEGRTENIGTLPIATARIGFRKSAYYLRFLERGARPHMIAVYTAYLHRRTGVQRINTGRRGSKQVLRTAQGEFLGQSVIHPGVRARPFLSPALRSAQDNALVAIRGVLKDAISEAL
jgi:HK97 gp10 family phage protein